MACFLRILVSQLLQIVYFLSFAFTAAVAATIDITSKQAIVIDYTTNAILLEKNADELMYPSSMSKLMTLYMLFEKLHTGDLSLEDKFFVSERAWRTAGSKMFVVVNSRVAISDLLRGIIVQSGNDACVAVAENLSDTEEDFASSMNAKAKELGLQNSTFRNASGWPEKGHVMTARDLVVLAKHLIADFPEYYSLFQEISFTYNGIRQGNRNPLLYKPWLGVDGLKTGHTEESGYGLVASAVRDGRRIIIVLNGLNNMKQRAQESERLLNWAFQEFTNLTLFTAGETVTTADVWLGQKNVVPLSIEQSVTVTLPKKESKEVKVTTIFNNPVLAPISKGDYLGTLVITIPGSEVWRIPLTAGVSIDSLNFLDRLLTTAKYVLLGRK